MNFDLLFDKNYTQKVKLSEIDELQNYLLEKKGWIYIAKSKDNNRLKIGRTGKTPLERAKSLSSTGVFHSYEIIFSLPFFNQYIAEKNIHTSLKKFRTKKEFFLMNETVAIEIIKAEYEKEKKLLSRFLNVSILEEDINLVAFSISQKI